MNGQPSRLFDIDKDELARMAIEDSEEFFDTLEAESVLEIIGEGQSPASIFNKVSAYMKEIGHDVPDSAYEIKEDKKEGLIMVAIDSSENLIPEFDGFGRGDKNALNEKLIQYIKIFNLRYDINVVITIPTDVGFVRVGKPKDTIPNIKHLGIFGKNCHVGTIVHNAIPEKTFRFLLPNDKASAYISNGRNVLRFWFVVRNTAGADAVRQRYLMLPGSGYCVEHPLDENSVEDFSDIYDVLMESKSPYGTEE